MGKHSVAALLDGLLLDMNQSEHSLLFPEFSLYHDS